MCTLCACPYVLVGALEAALARTLTSSPAQLPGLLALAMLQMRDAERVALHNEMEHVEVCAYPGL